jgi:hypothetical protein
MTTPAERAAKIETIRCLPEQLEAAVSGLTDAQLDFRPSPREWSVRQVVHHLVDSHSNAFTRLKLALTEDRPTIKPYDQEAFAELPDSLQAPLEMSLAILRGLHARWVFLWNRLTDEQWARGYLHPEYGEYVTIDGILDTYANHCTVHLNQIAEVKQAQGLEA